MSKEKRKQPARLTQRVASMVTAIKEDIKNGTWKIIVSALLSSILTIAGASYVIGRNDATVEARLSRLEEQFKDANQSLKEIASTLSAQEKRDTAIQYQLDEINNRALNRWSSQDQKIFALQLQLNNQTLDVPSVDEILRSRTMP